MSEIIGTNASENLEATQTETTVIGLAGNDTINGADGADVIIGDYSESNMLADSNTATSFAQYGENGAWDISQDSTGHMSMTQTVLTNPGAAYSVSFGLAANYGAGTVSGAVEVLWNGAVINSFDTNSALFDAHSISFVGTGGLGQLTFRSIESTAEVTSPVINTEGPIFHYDQDMTVGGKTITVKAFAEGQNGIYQVMDGKLKVFDPETETYSEAGADATVTINAIGFNIQDNMIYGIAVSKGKDSLGNAVDQADLVMMDAVGNSFRIGETPYRSWTADFDDQGNLWSFQSSMDRVTMIDVDSLDASGNPVSTTFKFPKEMVADQMWDVAYDAASQTFYGIVRPSNEGKAGKLFTIDISEVAAGGEPKFSTEPIRSTFIDGEMIDGMPAIAFGALVVDGEGNIYAGGNSGDHDMNDSTGSSGGIYRVQTNPDTDARFLELTAQAPRAASNDGAMDPRAMDPFADVDTAATILIRAPEMTPVPTADLTYDDDIYAGSGADTVYGGIGEDMLVGSSTGDELNGGAGDDALFGGIVPGTVWNGLVSHYDENGLRFDQFGNPLPEDDDTLNGGDGDDFLDGSAGHDFLNGDLGNDIMNGGSGNDVMVGGDGSDSLSGGGHDDDLLGGSGADTLLGGSGNDQLSGEDGEDLLNGGSGDDALNGGGSDDELRAGPGQDTVDGGAGDDWIDAGVDDDLIKAGAGDDHIRAGKGDDEVYGEDGDDYISAYVGDDVIFGGAGRDKIAAGRGTDQISGGSGSDTFVFRKSDLDGNTNTISDFSRVGTEADRLDLRALGMLDGGLTAEEWMLQNVSSDTDGVTIAMADTFVFLNDHDDLNDAFMTSVYDGIML